MQTENQGVQAGSLPESLLIHQILEGEKDLFEILVRRYNQVLYCVLKGFLEQEADILDVMQDTYLKAFEKLHQYRSEAAFSTWLLRIGIHEALHHLKHRKRKCFTQMSVSGAGNDFPLKLALAGEADAEKRISGREATALLEQAIDSLPGKYRSIYILKEMQYLTDREIATCLRISHGNVKVRLHRARELMKSALLQLVGTEATVYEFGGSRCDSLTRAVMNCMLQEPPAWLLRAARQIN